MEYANFFALFKMYTKRRLDEGAKCPTNLAPIYQKMNYIRFTYISIIVHLSIFFLYLDLNSKILNKLSASTKHKFSSSYKLTAVIVHKFKENLTSNIHFIGW